MSSTFYIKQFDTDEELKAVLNKRQKSVNGVVPADRFWITSKTVSSVFFSMKKIKQLMADGTTYLYPDGTLHYSDGTILNPLGNPDAYISSIILAPGEILNADYSVLQVNLSTRYPNGLIKDQLGITYLPDNSILLQNGMINLPPTLSYPTGYIYNPGSIDRTDYYKVGNPTENEVNGDGSINLPDECYIGADNYLYMPPKVIALPSGTDILSTTTIKLPTGTTVETSTTINRDNALVLPTTTSTHSSLYTVTYSSSHRSFILPTGSILIKVPALQTARVVFPNASYIAVPYDSFELAANEFVFPYGTSYVGGTYTFTFPGNTITLPLDATITEIGIYINVTFPVGTTLTTSPLQAALITRNYLDTAGVTHLYDGSTITLNENLTTLYNGFTFYPRGTQKNSLGTIIHPDSAVAESIYLRYFPEVLHPLGLLIRTDGAIVNADGTFTRLDNSVVDASGTILEPANTDNHYYTSTVTPPFIPTSTQSSYLYINHRTGSYEEITYIVTGSETASATLLKYQWSTPDTDHLGLFSGEFEINYNDSTKRTFPVMKNDALFIEILDHFAS